QAAKRRVSRLAASPDLTFSSGFTSAGQGRHRPTAVPTLVMVMLTSLPSLLMAKMATPRISASSTAYSTAAGPSSSPTNPASRRTRRIDPTSLARGQGGRNRLLPPAADDSPPDSRPYPRGSRAGELFPQQVTQETDAQRNSVRQQMEARLAL